MIGFIFIIASSFAQGPCATDHFEDALELNRARKSTYADLSNGQSLAISRRLIAYDRLLIPVARLLDVTDQNQVLCKLLPRLKGETPVVKTASIAPPRLELSLIDAWKPRLKKIRQTRHWKALNQEVTRILNSPVFEDPHYLCMTRRYFETLKQLSEIAPESWALTNWLTLGFSQAMNLDLQAVALQSQGIPILCADLSPLPQL